MKVVILYRPQSDHRRKVEEFKHDFSRLHPGINMELKDVETRDGWSTGGIYDITSYPAVLALRDDGSVLQAWQGQDLPLMDEVAAQQS